MLPWIVSSNTLMKTGETLIDVTSATSLDRRGLLKYVCNADPEIGSVQFDYHFNVVISVLLLAIQTFVRNAHGVIEKAHLACI